MVKRFILWVLALAVSVSCGERHYVIIEVAKALESAQPGDTIIVQDGHYPDVDLHWHANATADKPVVVKALNPGKVVITGKSSLHISGSGLEVNGFLFQSCTASRGTIVEFRDGDSLASGCRLTDCVIDRCVPERRDVSYSYVHLYGRGNRVDHCSFTGKLNLGVTLIVMLNYPDCDDNHHSIDHNYFGPRPVYGSNGAETIRVGTSQQCMQNSRTLITENFFDRCNGEVEVVSIKSSENVIKGNVFYECQGVLALRHGDRNQALDNLFVGHGVRNTGGVRIVGEDQVVRGNTFLGLAGERFFSALALMYGVPNSLPNRYMQVKNTIVENNVFQACRSIDFNCGKDFERTLAPVGTVWEGNIQEQVQTVAEPSYEELSSGRGASWYSPKAASEQAVEEIVLKDSLYVLSEGMRITKPTLIRAEEGASPEVIFAGKKSQNMITICDGGSLTVRGIRFSGRLTPGYSLAKGIISTDDNMIEPYTLTVEDCTFSDCGESGFVPIRGLKGTFGETVTVRGCTFEALSGDAVNYAAETEDKGRYNADDILIENCTFNRILGIPVQIARNGSDESTAGPYVSVRGCTFDDCCNKVRGSVLRIIGAQVLDISGNTFTGSGRGGYSIRLDEAPWEKVTLKENTFNNSGKVLSNRAL
ncbi:MAG: right-handed parallel beta-helix repeat-containing protein [Bacteroidales bacterium]|nr:right-handed parallel beta-helix repeat-containing protein [Bacteroidales bacterium]